MKNENSGTNIKSKTAWRRWHRTGIKCGIYLVLYFATILSGYIFYLYLSTFTWMKSDTVYPILHFLNLHKETFVVGGVFLGLFIIVLWDYRRMYLLVEEEVSQALLRAEEAESRKNDLVVYLAHDLKTPLTSVTGYLQLLQDEPDVSQETRMKYIRVAAAKAERLDDLLNEFFEITRYNLTQITLEKSEINLTRMLEQIIFEFQPMMKEKKLTCELQAPKDYSFVCDSDRMQRVFDNLLRNALNYSFPDTKIQIRMQEIKGEVILEFENEGNTISKEKLQRIFEQFFRLDDSRGTRTGGSGVGLAIAKEIVELHDGTIQAYSENNHIRFRVSIPIQNKIKL